MNNASIPGKDYIDSLFSDSIYQNTHLGWLDLWTLPGSGGSICLFDQGSPKFLIAIQSVSDSISWLHSFYCDRRPSDFDLIRPMKSILSSGKKSIYAISSHAWFSELLENNGFIKCDEIIQMETDGIILPPCAEPLHLQKLSIDDLSSILSDCETAFPPLWRLVSYELETAVKTADYAESVRNKDGISAYLLAEITDDNCHILRLATNTAYQRQGIASSMVNDMIRLCMKTDIHHFSVNTNKKNSAAVSFYHSLNFSQVGSVFPIYHRFI